MVKGSHDNLRSMWTLGIYPKPEEDNIEDTIIYYAQKYDVALLNKCIATEPIIGTKLVYTLF